MPVPFGACDTRDVPVPQAMKISHNLLGSIGVIIAAGIIWLTGWDWVDPLVAILIALWVLPRTWILLRDTTNILLQGVPRGLDLDTVRAAIAEVPGVADVHDLHLWSIAGDDRSLTAHILIGPDTDAIPVRRAVAAVLAERFAITHTTLQTEDEAGPCAGCGHD